MNKNLIYKTEVKSRNSRGSSFLGLFTLGCVLNISWWFVEIEFTLPMRMILYLRTNKSEL